jgi:hypothetical protein
LEEGDLLGEGSAPWFGDVHPGPGPTPLVAFVNLDIPGLLQGLQVTRQVAISKTQSALQEAELDPICFGEHDQNAQASALVDDLV